jgi:hypothetical protein
VGVRLLIVIVLSAGLIGGCSALKGSDDSAALASGENPPPPPTKISLANSKPLDVYVVMGGNIKRCWFNAVDPLLPDHVYRADVSPSGLTATVTVHQRANLGRPGLRTYVIDFKQVGASTVITTENIKMTPELAAKMEYDLNRWKRGASNCSKEMPATAEAPPPAGEAR